MLTRAQSGETPDGQRTFTSPAAGTDSPRFDPPPYTDDVKSELEDIKSETPRSAGSVAAVSATENTDATTTTSALRQRVKSSAEGAKEAGGQLAQAMPHNVQGVPVKVTALLCFLAFLVGYFFF